MEQPDKKMWFQPKGNGYGSGLPISWEGWVLLAGFLAAVFGLAWASRHFFAGRERAVAHIAGVVALLIPFVLIVRARTESGWKWRDGSDD